MTTKTIAIKGTIRTLTKFSSIDSVSNTNIATEFWNVTDSFSNNDKILIEYSSIQLGAKAVITNTDYIKITVLESNCLPSTTIPESTIIASCNQKLSNFSNIKDFIESLQIVCKFEGINNNIVHVLKP